MNPPGGFGISIGTALGAVAMSLRPITVRITSIRASHGAGDIRLAPGNSGGPLADTRRRIPGVNSMIVGNLRRAVTSDAVEDFLLRFGLAEDA